MGLKKIHVSDFKCADALQLQPNSASGSGALEHDPSSIYLRIPAGEAVPGPLPLGVSVIDASVALFGVVFPHVSYKHRFVIIKANPSMPHQGVLSFNNIKMRIIYKDKLSFFSFL